MKAEKWEEEEEEKGGDEGCNEKAAAAAALVTQLATALVCSAPPCRGKLSSLAQLHLLRIFCCCQGNKLSGLGKKNLHIQKMSFQMLASTWSLHVFSI